MSRRLPHLWCWVACFSLLQWHCHGCPGHIKAYRAGVPANSKAFPDGSKIAKIEWQPRKILDAPFSAATPDTRPLTEVEFIEKDSKRFADTRGWGYGAVKCDAVSDTFTPVTLADKPPQRNDALPVA
jgi:Cytochrome P460